MPENLPPPPEVVLSRTGDELTASFSGVTVTIGGSPAEVEDDHLVAFGHTAEHPGQASTFFAVRPEGTVFEYHSAARGKPAASTEGAKPRGKIASLLGAKTSPTDDNAGLQYLGEEIDVTVYPRELRPGIPVERVIVETKSPPGRYTRIETGSVRNRYITDSSVRYWEERGEDLSITLDPGGQPHIRHFLPASDIQPEKGEKEKKDQKKQDSQRRTGVPGEIRGRIVQVSPEFTIDQHHKLNGWVIIQVPPSAGLRRFGRKVKEALGHSPSTHKPEIVGKGRVKVWAHDFGKSGGHASSLQYQQEQGILPPGTKVSLTTNRVTKKVRTKSGVKEQANHYVDSPIVPLK